MLALLETYNDPEQSIEASAQYEKTSIDYCQRWSRRMSKIMENLFGLSESKASRFCRMASVS